MESLTVSFGQCNADARIPSGGTDRAAAVPFKRKAVAFVVCQAIGLETGSAASDYIQLYDGKTETLAQSLDRIQHVAAEIIAALKCPNEQAIAA
jgi:hypothetical protein